MPSIDEFPEDPKYTIKTVCTETGIRPVTLRAWERRHAVLIPARADNRYRLYSERDVAVLRWVKNRVDSGISISNAVKELHTSQKKGSWPEAVPSVPNPVFRTRASPPEAYAKLLYQAVIQHDEVQAGDLLQEAHAIFDLVTVCGQILTPCLVEIGEAWYRGEIRITTEHFTSSFVRGKLLTLMQAYPTRRNTPYILVGCAPTEHHEIGSMMVAVLLRSYGYRVEYLGPDIPLDDLVDYASFEHPALVCLSASNEEAALKLLGLQEKLNKLHPAPIFAYGGRAFDIHADLRRRIAGQYVGQALPETISAIRDLVSPNERDPYRRLA